MSNNPFSRQVGAGTTVLSPTDFYIEIDTSLGVPTIVLPNISTIMDIVAKLGITFAGIRFVDISNNASVNNINWVASDGNNINGVSVITLNTDGVGGFFTTISGSQWDYVQNSTGGGNLSVTDSSTIDLTYTNNVLSGVVKYTDGFILGKRFINVNTNYIPNVQIYNGAGEILPTFYSDINYAASLNIHDQSSYSATFYGGSFNSTCLDNTTGFITIPVSGLYLLQAEINCNISGTQVGNESLVSDNVNTSGIAWNDGNGRTAYMQLSVCLDAVGGDKNNVTVIPLTDMGKVKARVGSMTSRLDAGQKIKLVVLNNSDLPFYGDTDVSRASGLSFSGLKISE